MSLTELRSFQHSRTSTRSQHVCHMDRSQLICGLQPLLESLQVSLVRGTPPLILLQICYVPSRDGTFRVTTSQCLKFFQFSQHTLEKFVKYLGCIKGQADFMISCGNSAQCCGLSEGRRGCCYSSQGTVISYSKELISYLEIKGLSSKLTMVTVVLKDQGAHRLHSLRQLSKLWMSYP